MEDDAGMCGEFGQALSPVGSGSKRKRTLEWTLTVPEADVRLVVDPEQHEANHGERHNQDDDDNGDGRHTPKRSRPSASPKQEARSIRRKGARYGLSSLNKCHAEAPSDKTRPSRFHEGSMSDKPSAQPPSLFTRDHPNPGLPALALANVDHLMTRYHEENSIPSIHQPAQHDTTEPPPPAPLSIHTNTSHSASTAAAASTKASGLFRFGKMFSSSFSPANVWESFSRTWKESREDLTVRNIEENRKAAQDAQRAQDDKAMYEQAYQELKKSGQFNFTVIPNKALTSPRLGANSQFNSPVRQPLTSPRHAAAYAHLRANVDHPHSHSRDTSLDSNDLAPPPQLAALFKQRDAQPTSEPQQQQHHLSPEKSLSKRKSFFTLRGASLRAPSLSSLKRGRSHANLSDTFVRNTTPSQSPEKPASNHLTLQSLTRSQSKKDLNRAVKLNKRVSNLESKLADARRELNDAITNASPLPPLPSRFEKFTPTSKSKFTKARFGLGSSKLPSLPSESLISPTKVAQAQDTPSLVRPRPQHTQSFDLTHLRNSTHTDNSVIVLDTPRSEIQSFLPVDYYHQGPMDPAALASSDPADHSEAENRPSLDARLKALDASVKSRTKQPAASKKRKSKDDLTYKPPKNDDDDDEDELEHIKEKPKKKRKSTGNKATTVEPASKQPGSDVGHGELIKANSKQQDSTKPQTARSSMDSLDPIDEEGNIVVAPRPIPSHIADEQPTHARNDSHSQTLKSILVNKHETVRPSSRGSNKRPSSSQRHSSPPPSAAFVKPAHIAVETRHGITVTPGVGSVPAMPTIGVVVPKIPTTDVNKVTEEQADAGAKDWDWPEDVF